MKTSADTIVLSVITPAYNEAEGIDQAIEHIQTAILDQISHSELIVISDGSTDQTFEKIQQWSQKDSRIRAVNAPHRGHGPTVITGLEVAHGDYVFLIDCDEQIPLAAFQPLWVAAQTQGAAMGVREQRVCDPWFRRILTKGLRRFIHLSFGVHLEDPNIAFKVFRRSIWLEAKSSISPNTLTPSLFLAIFIAKQRYACAYLKVPYQARSYGTSILRPWRLLCFCYEAFFQLLTFRRSFYR